jgi:hypothetical protein
MSGIHHMLLGGLGVPTIEEITEMWLNGGTDLRNALASYPNGANDNWSSSSDVDYQNGGSNNRNNSTVVTSLTPQSLPSAANANTLIPRTSWTTVVMLNLCGKASGDNWVEKPNGNATSVSYSSSESTSFPLNAGTTLISLFQVNLSYDRIGTQTYTFTKNRDDRQTNTQQVIFLPGKYNIQSSSSDDAGEFANGASTTIAGVQENDILITTRFGFDDAYRNKLTIGFSDGGAGTKVTGMYSRWYDNHESEMHVVTAAGTADIDASSDAHLITGLLLRPESM